MYSAALAESGFLTNFATARSARDRVPVIDIALFGRGAFRLDAEGHNPPCVRRNQTLPPGTMKAALSRTTWLVGARTRAKTTASLSRICAKAAPAAIAGPESRFRRAAPTP